MDEKSFVVTPAGDIAFEDFHGLHEMLMSEFAYMEHRINPPSSMNRLTVSALRQKAKIEHLIVALNDAQLVGCVFIRPAAPAWYLGKLAVSGSMRSRGVGSQLLASAERLCADHGGSCIELEVRVELTENHEFFEKYGFTQCGENAHKGFDHPTSFLFRKQVE